MKIVNLIENTEGTSGCAYAHGLSFYVETKKHKLLLDLGPSEETLRNARHLGIDLTRVDTVILSHGHYDHSGGILPFTQINPHATIYMQR
nr:MBL fold metallo-hydrolase [Lachnospiraceae bacterium]